MPFISDHRLRSLFLLLTALLCLLFGLIYFSNEPFDTSQSSEVHIGSKANSSPDTDQPPKEPENDSLSEQEDDSEETVGEANNQARENADHEDISKVRQFDNAWVEISSELVFLAGSDLQITFDQSTGQGSLLINRWGDGISGLFIKGLTADETGKSLIHFHTGLQNISESQLSGVIAHRIRWISSHPFEYLSHNVKNNLASSLQHVPGQSELNATGEANLLRLQQVMSMRPGLNVVIEVGVSKELDSDKLSRAALQSSLLELYSAISPSGDVVDVEAMPLDVKAALLEQMYLAVQQQKVPEVGVKTPEERVKAAEEWLLKNWPVDQNALAQLQDNRLKYLREEMKKAGLATSRILLKPAEGSTKPESVLMFR